MKLISLAIVIVSFAAAGFVIRQEGTREPAKATLKVAQTQEHELPSRRTVREDAIIKKMDKLEHDLIYLQGRYDEYAAR